MPVWTILTQKLASTLMQSGQNPILWGYPDDYPDKNALCATLPWIFLPFLVYIYVNNGANFRIFTYSDKFGAPKILEP
jgi:hypothetical protein